MKLTSKVNFSFGRERQDGHHGDSKTLTVDEKNAKFTVFLMAGVYDSVEVFKSDDAIYVYCRNTSNLYMGLEVFDFDGELIGDIFINDIDELFTDIQHLSSINCVKALELYS